MIIIPPAEYSSVITTERGTVNQSVNTKATVITDTPIYENGSVITNSPVYSTQKMSHPTITINTRGIPEGATNVTQNLRLILDGRYNNNTYYKQDVMLATTKSANPISIKLNISQVKKTGQDIRSVYNDSGVVYASITAKTSFNYQGKTIVVTSDLPLQVKGELYSIGSGKQSNTQDYEIKSSNTTYSQFNASSPYLAFSFLLFLTGGGLVIASKKIADESRTNAAYIKHKHREWITTVENHKPESVEQASFVKTMPDLIELAMDTNTRVFYNEVENYFFVDVNDTRFVYQP